MTLGGTLIVRNAFEFDYCLKAAIQSLLGVCDEVVVVDGESTDGTWEMLNQMRDTIPAPKELIILQRQWRPNELGKWLSDLTNVAKDQLKAEMHLNLQADEVIHENSYNEIRQLAQVGQIYTVERLNFWGDHNHILPPNEKVGQTIVRLAPTRVPSVGDAQGLDPTHGWSKSGIQFFHYGFIRDPKKLAAKARPMQQAFFNTTDSIWEDVDKRGMAALLDSKNPTAVPVDRLVKFWGTHPRVAKSWLEMHGYTQ